MSRSDLTAKIDILLQLQSNELQIASLRASLEGVPDRLNHLTARLEEFQTRMQASETRMADLQKTYRQQEAEAQSIEAQIEKSNEKLRTVKTNKEYQAGLQEIEDLNRLQSSVEDKMLDCREAIDEAEAASAAQRESVSAFSRQMEEEKTQIERESAQMQQQLQRLLHVREQIVAAAGTELLAKYEQIKRFTGPTVVAAVKASVCQGCNMNIPPQMYNELQRFDRLLACPHCERIIYPHGSLEDGAAAGE